MKKYINIKHLYTGLLALGIALLGGCDDDEHYDFEGDSTNRVYLNVGHNMVKSYNGYTFDIIHTPAGSLSDGITASFPVRCTMEATADTRVTLATDNSLIEAYNNQHGTTYSVLPDGFASLSTSSLTIASGATASSDSVTVSVPENKFADLTAPGYLLPVRITAIDNAHHAEVSTNLNTVYLVINTQETNCYNSPTESDMTGAPISDRSAWVPALSIPVSSGSLTNMLNGNTWSYWYVAPAQECTLTMDLGTEYTGITGIRLHSFRSSYSLSSAEVYASSDGVQWESQGNATLATSSSYQYIKFYVPVTAQYLRLDITGWTSQYLILSEYDVYIE